MKTKLGDKLAASVRGAKQQQTSPATPTTAPGEPAPPVKPMPARRVWPD